MDIVSLIIQLLSGAAGGNLAGNVAKDANLGPAIPSRGRSGAGSAAKF